MRTLRQRFEEKYIPEPMSGCWLWTAGMRGKEYGAFRKGGETRYAHRVSYELHVGPIPSGMCVLHRCDTPLCVNPGHLFLGTYADNAADRDNKGRGAIGERNGYSSLTEKQVLEIRIASGLQREIASQYDIHRAHVGKIKRRDVWAHL